MMSNRDRVTISQHSIAADLPPIHERPVLRTAIRDLRDAIEKRKQRMATRKAGVRDHQFIAFLPTNRERICVHHDGLLVSAFVAEK